MQAQFVAEYLVDQNGKQAAIRAGASPKGAEQQASKWLRLAKVKAAVAQRLERALVKVDLRVEDVLLAIQRHVLAGCHADAGDFFDEHHNLKNIRDMSPEARMNIGAVEVVRRNLTSGDGKVDDVIKVKARDQLVPEQALHEAIRSRDLSEVPLRIGVTKAYETFDPLHGGHFE